MYAQPQPQVKVQSAKASTRFLQRKCACGQHTGSGGECEDCKKKRTGMLQRSAVNASPLHPFPPVVSKGLRSPDQSPGVAMEPKFKRDFSRTPTYPSAPPAIQTKLAINPPGDVYEQEADRVADQVLGAPMQHRFTETPRIQRFARPSSEKAGAVPESVDRALTTSGHLLEPVLRQDMEQRFGRDFSQVRIHAGHEAAKSAQAVNANAYTVGSHIFFGNGRYAPNTTTGKRLVAHELVHVVQQSQAGLAESSGPGQKAGLSIQRQPCDKANDRIVTGLLKMETPAVKCEPTPETLANVRANAGIPRDILGVTRAITGNQRIEFQELKGSMCRATIRELESLSFNPFMYTKAGTYDDGTETVPRGAPCPAGRQIPRRLKISEPMAQKLRDGEIEHCEDHKLAFALSQGKFNQAIRDLGGDFCAAGRTGNQICEPEFAERFKNRTGVDFNRQTAIGQCLHDKTKIRDDPAKGWHNVIYDQVSYAPGCSSVTYIPSPGMMTNINKHASSTIVKGCGEPA